MQSKDPPQGSLGRKLNGFDENDLFWLILELTPEDGLTTDFSFSFFHSLILLLSGRASLMGFWDLQGSSGFLSPQGLL